MLLLLFLACQHITSIKSYKYSTFVAKLHFFIVIIVDIVMVVVVVVAVVVSVIVVVKTMLMCVAPPHEASLRRSGIARTIKGYHRTMK